MTRPRTWLAAALLILLASCGPRAAPVSTATSTPLTAAVETSIPHASELRFALVGEVTDANVWALFDAQGYSYNNYAVCSEYWPRLYRLSIPERQFQPMAASGMPSPIQRDGDFYTATVLLRTDLNWTDGSPFTADDVAFTINTALSFQLGFDWHDYYNPAWLDHAEAIDTHTVKFYFKRAPNVGAWQYGALQGPIVQKVYWLPKIAASQALLPSSDLPMQIEALKARVAGLQQQVDALNLSTATAPMSGEEARQNQVALNHQQRDLNAATGDLAKAQADFAAALNAARASLYAVDYAGEPTLGNWIPAGEENGAWVNKVNPAHPFGEPHFDRVSYQAFGTEDDAVTALMKGEAASILEANESFEQKISAGQSITLKVNQRRDMAFLIFNPHAAAPADSMLRQALACMIYSAGENGPIHRLNSFVLPDVSFWYNADAMLPCNGLDDASRLAKAVTILKSGGYSWDQEPAKNNDGKGLRMPNGSVLPDIALLVSSEVNRMASAAFVQQQAGRLGISLAVHSVSQDEINYAVFSSRQYDVAVLDWQVSEYPGYLCEWFGDGNPFGYHSDRLQSACEALDSTSDLDQARHQVYEIQSVLAQDLPFIPLYSGLTYDAYRDITYPFDQVLGGLSGVYGAPSLAVPASH